MQRRSPEEELFLRSSAEANADLDRGLRRAQSDLAAAVSVRGWTRAQPKAMLALAAIAGLTTGVGIEIAARRALNPKAARECCRPPQATADDSKPSLQGGGSSWLSLFLRIAQTAIPMLWKSVATSPLTAAQPKARQESTS